MVLCISTHERKRESVSAREWDMERGRMEKAREWWRGSRRKWDWERQGKKKKKEERREKKKCNID